MFNKSGFTTAIDLNDSFSVAQSFVYAALYGALPPKQQKDFLWEESYVGESKRIVRMRGYEIEKADINWDVSRKIICELDNTAEITVFLKQRRNGDGSKDQWRVVKVDYIHIGFDFNGNYQVYIE